MCKRDGELLAVFTPILQLRYVSNRRRPKLGLVVSAEFEPVLKP